eukprot:gene57717-biopygen32732
MRPCRQINAANSSVATVYYLNSAIDWQFYTLHDGLVAHPEWRLRDASGADILITAARRWGFNVSVAAMKAAWVEDCVSATERGWD